MKRWSLWAAVAAGTVAAGVLLFSGRPDPLWERWWGLIAADPEEMTARIRSYGLLAPAVSLALMVAQAVISPLPASLIIAANGAVFGLVPGAVLSWLGSVLGAAAAFGLARWLGAGFVRRHVTGVAWERVEAFSGSRGFWVILLARLIPIVSFDLISYLAGLSSLRWLPFLAATAIGAAPSTLAYAWLGSDLLRPGSTWRWSLGAVAVLCAAGAAWGLGRRVRERPRRSPARRRAD